MRLSTSESFLFCRLERVVPQLPLFPLLLLSSSGRALFFHETPVAPYSLVLIPTPQCIILNWFLHGDTQPITSPLWIPFSWCSTSLRFALCRANLSEGATPLDCFLGSRRSCSPFPAWKAGRFLPTIFFFFHFLRFRVVIRIFRPPRVSCVFR